MSIFMTGELHGRRKLPLPSGQPIRCFARISLEAAGSTARGGLPSSVPPQRADVQALRGLVSLTRPGVVDPLPEDQCPVDFAFGPEASSEEIHMRSIAPLVAQVVHGVNCTVMTFGAWNSKKTSTMEGAVNVTGEPGIIVPACNALFKELHAKGKSIAERLTTGHNAAGKFHAFDFSVESWYLECNNEQCMDLYQAGEVQVEVTESQTGLEGEFAAFGARVNVASNAAALVAHFFSGRAARSQATTSVGSAAIFTVQVLQYVPSAADDEDENSVVVSRLQFVDAPGCEKLAMDPEVLLLREGPTLNRSLLALGNVVRALSNQATVEQANAGESVLTKLLSEALGGNCYTVVIATLAVGQWQHNKNTLRYLNLMQKIVNFPVRNHDKVRGLLQRAARRHAQLQNVIAALRDQLHRLPVNAGPAQLAMHLTKASDLEHSLIKEREEHVRLRAEVESLPEQLEHSQGADPLLLGQKQEPQAALIRNKEEQTETTQELIDLEEDHMKTKHDKEEAHSALEMKLSMLEAEKLEWDVQSQTCENTQGDAELKAFDTKARAELETSHSEVESANKALEKAEQQIEIMKEKLRRTAESQSESVKLSNERDKALSEKTLAEVKLEQERREFQAKLEGHSRSLAELSRAWQLQDLDPGASVLDPERLPYQLEDLLSDMHHVQADKEKDALRQMDAFAMQAKEAKQQVDTLYKGYRDLRYLAEDALGKKVLHEDELVKRPAYILSDDAGATLLYQRERILDLEHQVAVAKANADLRSIRANALADRPAEDAEGGDAGRKGSGAGEACTQFGDKAVGQQAAGVVVECNALISVNHQLKVQLEQLQACLASGSHEQQGKMRETSPVASKEVSMLREEMKFLKEQMHLVSKDQSRRGMAEELAHAKRQIKDLKEQAREAKAKSKEELWRQMKTFTEETQMHLETDNMSLQTRLVEAETQVEHLQTYISHTAVAYQREIIRLREVVAQYDWSKVKPSETERLMAGMQAGDDIV